MGTQLPNKKMTVRIARGRVLIELKEFLTYQQAPDIPKSEFEFYTIHEISYFEISPIFICCQKV